MILINIKKNISFKLIALIVLAAFIANDISWALPDTARILYSDKLAAVTRFKELDFKKMADMIYAARELSAVLIDDHNSGPEETERLINRLNLGFPESGLTIGSSVETGKIEGTIGVEGKAFKRLKFTFSGLPGSYSVLFFDERIEPSLWELEQLGIKDPAKHHLDMPGLNGVWFLYGERKSRVNEKYVLEYSHERLADKEKALAKHLIRTLICGRSDLVEDWSVTGFYMPFLMSRARIYNLSFSEFVSRLTEEKNTEYLSVESSAEREYLKQILTKSVTATSATSPRNIDGISLNEDLKDLCREQADLQKDSEIKTLSITVFGGGTVSNETVQVLNEIKKAMDELYLENAGGFDAQKWDIKIIFYDMQPKYLIKLSEHLRYRYGLDNGFGFRSINCDFRYGDLSDEMQYEYMFEDKPSIVVMRNLWYDHAVGVENLSFLMRLKQSLPEKGFMIYNAYHPSDSIITHEVLEKLIFKAKGKKWTTAPAETKTTPVNEDRKIDPEELRSISNGSFPDIIKYFQKDRQLWDLLWDEVRGYYICFFMYTYDFTFKEKVEECRNYKANKDDLEETELVKITRLRDAPIEVIARRILRLEENREANIEEVLSDSMFEPVLKRAYLPINKYNALHLGRLEFGEPPLLGYQMQFPLLEGSEIRSRQEAIGEILESDPVAGDRPILDALVAAIGLIDGTWSQEHYSSGSTQNRFGEGSVAEPFTNFLSRAMWQDLAQGKKLKRSEREYAEEALNALIKSVRVTADILNKARSKRLKDLRWVISSLFDKDHPYQMYELTDKLKPGWDDAELLKYLLEHKEKLNLVVRALYELDMYRNIAHKAKAESWSEFPVILDAEKEGGPVLRIKNGHAPLILEDSIKGERSEPNSINFGGRGGEKGIIVVAPNGFGKSTLIEMCSQLSVLAALGAPLPVDEMEMTPMWLCPILNRGKEVRQKNMGLGESFMRMLEYEVFSFAEWYPNTLVIFDDSFRISADVVDEILEKNSLKWLVKKGCIVLDATHHVERGTLLALPEEDASFGIRHLTENHELKEGKVNDTGPMFDRMIEILKRAGVPADFIEAVAEDMAEAETDLKMQNKWNSEDNDTTLRRKPAKTDIADPEARMGNKNDDPSSRFGIFPGPMCIAMCAPAIWKKIKPFAKKAKEILFSVHDNGKTENVMPVHKRLLRIAAIPLTALFLSYLFGDYYVAIVSSSFYAAVTLKVIVGGISRGCGMYMNLAMRGEKADWGKILRWTIAGGFYLGLVVFGAWYWFLKSYVPSDLLKSVLDITVFSFFVGLPSNFLIHKYIVNLNRDKIDFKKTIGDFGRIYIYNSVYWGLTIYFGMKYWPGHIDIIVANMALIWSGILTYCLDTWLRRGGDNDAGNSDYNGSNMDGSPLKFPMTRRAALVNMAVMPAVSNVLSIIGAEQTSIGINVINMAEEMAGDVVIEMPPLAKIVWNYAFYEEEFFWTFDEYLYDKTEEYWDSIPESARGQTGMHMHLVKWSLFNSWMRKEWPAHYQEIRALYNEVYEDAVRKIKEGDFSWALHVHKIVSYDREKEKQKAHEAGDSFIENIGMEQKWHEYTDADKKGPIEAKAYLQRDFIWEELMKRLKPSIFELMRSYIQSAPELFESSLNLTEEEMRNGKEKVLEPDKIRKAAEEKKRAKEEEEKFDSLSEARWENDGGALGNMDLYGKDLSKKEKVSGKKSAYSRVFKRAKAGTNKMNRVSKKYAPKDLKEGKTIYYIITDTIVPSGQRDLIKKLEQYMAKPRKKYIERIVHLDNENPDDFINNLKNIIADRVEKSNGNDIEFYVACDGMGDVRKILGDTELSGGILNVKALAFEYSKPEINAVQVQGIMLALRALRKGPDSLKTAYKFLTGKDLEEGIDDMVEIMKNVIFTLPPARIEIDEIDDLNRIIAKNVKTSA